MWGGRTKPVKRTRGPGRDGCARHRAARHGPAWAVAPSGGQAGGRGSTMGTTRCRAGGTVRERGGHVRVPDGALSGLPPGAPLHAPVVSLRLRRPRRAAPGPAPARRPRGAPGLAGGVGHRAVRRLRPARRVAAARTGLPLRDVATDPGGGGRGGGGPGRAGTGGGGGGRAVPAPPRGPGPAPPGGPPAVRRVAAGPRRPRPGRPGGTARDGRGRGVPVAGGAGRVPAGRPLLPRR